MSNTNIADKLKQTIDDLDLDKHVNELVIQVETAFTAAREKVGTLAAEHGGDVEAFLDKASATIGERTEGRYASHVDKVRETVSTAVTRLAEYRPSTTPVTPVEEIEPPTAE
ncbi:antitoxin [Nocardioides sp. B-3]|uniref:antitoxin n=1 Tax=Nocardioides sp. B-3 TaxID=2895565 RepID=UPI00215321FC|nr:antitoxin [Nocardioides sp. B-3]UUZ61188.1 antitoxin [Nocardioides sp. B-3]